MEQVLLWGRFNLTEMSETGVFASFSSYFPQ